MDARETDVCLGLGRETWIGLYRPNGNADCETGACSGNLKWSGAPPTDYVYRSVHDAIKFDKSDGCGIVKIDKGNVKIEGKDCSKSYDVLCQIDC